MVYTKVRIILKDVALGRIFPLALHVVHKLQKSLWKEVCIDQSSLFTFKFVLHTASMEMPHGLHYMEKGDYAIDRPIRG